MHNVLISSSVYNLHQLKSVLVQTTTAQYTGPLSILFQSTIGMHVRHIVEFYQCLINAQQTGVVNYDARERNKRIEIDLNYTMQLIDIICLGLRAIDSDKQLKMEASQDFGNVTYNIATNTMRELSYLIEHTVHHLAIIKMAYNQNFDGIIIDKNFGVAYSTIKHQDSVHGKLSAS